MEARHFRRSIMLLYKLCILLGMAGMFLYAYLNWYEAYFFFKGNLVLVFLYTFLYGLFLQTYGGYKIGMLRLRELVFSNALSACIANFIFYFIMSMIRYKLLPVWPMLLCTLAQSVLGVLLYSLAFRANERLYPPVPAVVIRSGTLHDVEATAKFASRSTRYRVQEELSADLSLAELTARIAPYSVVIASGMDMERRAALMGHCFECGKQFFLVPSMQDIMLNSASLFMADDTLLLRCRNRDFSPDQLAVKRLADVVFSALGLILLSPLMLLTALAIKLQDGGPVIFRQTRLTRGGREFTLYKFRSMVLDAEKHTGAVLAGRHDPRITRVGRLIRAARVDELPQLYNVLRGDMSLVGPRPERPELFKEICGEFPQFAYRLKVKAGLTGYAQLYGKYNTTFEDKVRLDLIYIERASILQDLQLVFYTFKILFMKESTEGVAADAAGARKAEADEKG